MLTRISAGLGILVVLFIAAYGLPAPNVQAPAPKDDTSDIARVLFAGDMFFDRYIRRITERVGGDFIFSCIRHRLLESDLVVGNLEGPITSHASVSAGTKPHDDGHFRFTFPPDTAELLKRNNIGAVSLGNNHIGNFGLDGMQQTRTALEASGIHHFGGLGGDEPILRIEVAGVPLSFISYNQFGGNGPDAILEKISAEKTAHRRTIVYAHWGEEYVPETAAMKETARLFAEADADAVIGSHPHVIQGSEYIGDTLVYYSLGNFIFDQYQSSDVTHGLLVLLLIPESPDKRISVTEYPVILTSDGRTCEREI